MDLPSLHGRLCSRAQVSAATRLAGLDWLVTEDDAVGVREEGGAPSSPTLANRARVSCSLFSAVAACLRDPEREVRAAAGRAAQSLVASHRLTHQQLAAMAALACDRLQDTDPAVAEVVKRELLASVAAAGAWCMRPATCRPVGHVESNNGSEEAAGSGDSSGILAKALFVGT